MAYRLDGVDDVVEFAITPFTGYVFGAATHAILFKRNALAATGRLVVIASSSLGARTHSGLNSSNVPQFVNSATATSGLSLASTSIWYLLAVTRAAGSGSARFHLWNGTTWTHGAAASGSNADLAAIPGTDRLRVGLQAAGSALSADVVCAGIKKADSADATIETLSVTSFQAWRDFGFDWLAGFEASGTLADQGAAGTGDETSRVGTSLVSDPPGWAWGAAAAGFVPQITVIT